MVEKAENREEDDEITIDFSKIKNWFKGFGGKSKKKEHHVHVVKKEESSEEDGASDGLYITPARTPSALK